MELQKENLSISEAVLGVAKENLNKTALTYMSIKISYKKLIERIQTLSVSFYSLGLKKGDIALVLLPNIPQAVYILYALNRIGAVAAFVSPLSAEAEIEMYISKTDAKLIIALDALYEKIQNVFAKTGDKKLITTSVFDEFKVFDIPKKSNEISWVKLIRNQSKRSIYISPQKPNDTAVILFSGGTTGKPKAVEITNLNLNVLAQGTEQVCEHNVIGVKMLSVLPVFHGFGLGICIHTVLYFGGQCILIPRFDADKTGRIVKKAKPEYLALVPAMLVSLINSKSLKNADLSGLSGVFCGGDILKEDLKEDFNKFLLNHNSQIKIRQGYGLTECVASSCLMPDHSAKKSSIGKPYPDTFYKIVKPNSCTEVPIGDIGEICISGKTVMKGYLFDKDETENVLKTHPDGKIWLHTGDMGCIDKDGYVYFKGRIKRIIISKGNNIFPQVLENALLKHSDVNDCCAVGVKDPDKSEIAVMFAVMNSKKFDKKIKENELLKHLEKHISKQLMPKKIYFISKIPKTNFGKTAYAELEKSAEEKIKKQTTAD